MHIYTDHSKIQGYADREREMIISLTRHDAKDVIEGFKALISKHKRALRDIDNNPNNEGQVTFQDKSRQRHIAIDQLEGWIELIERHMPKKQFNDRYIPFSR